MRDLNQFQNQVTRQPSLTGSSSEPFEIKTLNAENFSLQAPRHERVVEMIWVTKGNFQIMFDMETYTVSAGMIFFLPPGQTFYIRSAVGLEGVVLRFPAGMMVVDTDSPYPNLTFCTSRIFEVDAATTATLMSVMQCMRLELTNSHSQKAEVLSGYLRIVLIYLLRQRSTVLRSAFKADMAVLAKRFFELLERRYLTNKKVSEYADELAVTPNYLNYVIKQETGKSTSANIRNRLLLQAKRMALHQGISMKAVAYKLGFDDAAHFSKFFKVGCGCNFTAYRKGCPSQF